jgi:ribosomal protein S6--L-glutamate ligase
MKILVLTSNPESFSSRQMVRVFNQKGHKVQLKNPLEIGVGLSPAQMFDKKKQIPGFDIVLPRLGWLTYQQGILVSNAFEAAGFRVVNSSEAIEKAHNKLKAHYLLEKMRLPHPKTWFAPRQFESFWKEQDLPETGFIKLLYGSQGMGVSWYNSHEQLQSQIDFLRSSDTPFFIQQEIRGSEIRAFVVNGELVAAMERVPKAGEKRSNIFQGGKAKAARLSLTEEQTVLECVKAFDLDYAGVDFVRSGKKMSILEVNAFPGWEGLSSVSKISIPEKLLKLFES